MLVPLSQIVLHTIHAALSGFSKIFYLFGCGVKSLISNDNDNPTIGSKIQGDLFYIRWRTSLV